MQHANTSVSTQQQQNALATRAKIVPVIAATLAPDTPLFVRFKSCRMIVISCAARTQFSDNDTLGVCSCCLPDTTKL